jgi:hypothetical protein
MKAKERGGLQDDPGTDQPARAHDERTEPGDRAIRETEIGPPFSRPIQDQELVLDEHRFDYDGTGAAGTGEPGDRRHQMQKQDGQIAHRAILQDCGPRKNF